MFAQIVKHWYLYLIETKHTNKVNIMNNVYGYILDGNFYETGWTERGAKIAATRAGSEEVGYRSYINNMYINTSMKICGYWSQYGYDFDKC